MERLNFALLGCGRIGRMHAGILSRLEETNLVCVYDAVEEVAREVAEPLGAKVMGSDEEAVGADGVDAVLVASVTGKHSDHIEMCAKAGKPVLCEKPIDLDIERVRRCGEFLEKNPVPVQIGFNRRFDPGHAAAHRAMTEGEIGELHHVIITARDPSHPPRELYEGTGGLLRDMTIHDFDLSRFFLGEEPTEVFAVVGRVHDVKMLEDIGDHDSSMIILRAASGRLAYINNTRSAVYGYDQRIELHGSKGMLISGNRRPHELERYTKERTEAREPVLHFFIERYMEAYEQQLREFVAAVRSGGETPTTFRDGLRSLELAEAAYRSVESGAMVEIPG